MHDTTSPSPTGTLDPKTVERFHRGDRWLQFDRHFDGLSELIDCDGGCKDGIVQRTVSDYDPDLGPTYEAIDGSSHVDDAWLCPACTHAEAALAATVVG